MGTPADMQTIADHFRQVSVSQQAQWQQLPKVGSNGCQQQQEWSVHTIHGSPSVCGCWRGQTKDNRCCSVSAASTRSTTIPCQWTAHQKNFKTSKRLRSRSFAGRQQTSHCECYITYKDKVSKQGASSCGATTGGRRQTNFRRMQQSSSTSVTGRAKALEHRDGILRIFFEANKYESPFVKFRHGRKRLQSTNWCKRARWTVACQMVAARFLDTIAGLPGMPGQANAMSAEKQV